MLTQSVCALLFSPIRRPLKGSNNKMLCPSQAAANSDLPNTQIYNKIVNYKIITVYFMQTGKCFCFFNSTSSCFISQHAVTLLHFWTLQTLQIFKLMLKLEN